MNHDLDAKLLEQVMRSNAMLVEMVSDMKSKLGVVEDGVQEIKKYIPSTDRVTNIEYCKKRNMTRRNLDKWFEKGCPREDNRSYPRYSASLSNSLHSSN